MDFVLTFQVAGCGLEREHFTSILKAQKKLTEKLQWRWCYVKKPELIKKEVK